MYKASITLVSIIGSIGVFVGVQLLSNGPTGAVPRAPSLDVAELRPPPLEPASVVEVKDSQFVDADVMVLDEIRVPRQPRQSRPHPRAVPKRELQPCSEWEDVGPKSLQKPDRPVQMQRARLLC